VPTNSGDGVRNNLKAIRKLLKLSQAELAKLIGCTQSNIGHYESKGQRIRQEIAQRIVAVAKAKGVSITFEDIYGEINMEQITIVKEVKPDIKLLSDAFGGNHIVIDGRIFITINYLAPWIDNAGMRSLSSKIIAILKGKDGSSCVMESS
jgi:putative transcriptional regulator